MLLSELQYGVDVGIESQTITAVYISNVGLTKIGFPNTHKLLADLLEQKLNHPLVKQCATFIHFSVISSIEFKDYENGMDIVFHYT